MLLVNLVVLLVGLSVVTYFSDKTVKYSTNLATALKIPPLIIGALLLSFGTDLPEIANSIFSSYSGHGDVNIGNIMGSTHTQISRVLGLVAIIGGVVKAKRRNVLVLGGCAVAAVVIAAISVLDGVLGRLDALFLILAYVILLAISSKFTIKERGTSKDVDISNVKNKTIVVLMSLIISLIFVIVGAALVVESIVRVSEQAGFPAYLVSFFVMGLGTSIPELSVALAAIKERKYGLVLGDIMGSNITDATFALAIGPLLFPTKISAGIVGPLAIYVVAASMIIVSIFAWKERIDKRTAVLLICLYLVSFLFI